MSFAISGFSALADEKPITRSREISPSEMDQLLAACEPGPSERARLASLRRDLERAVNRERSRKGLGAVRLNSLLNDVAQTHSEDMARGAFMSHTGSDGSDVGARARRGAYRYRELRENVALGQSTAEDVMQAWMTSPGHRANILMDRAEHLGIGFALGLHKGSRRTGKIPGCYWTMLLARELTR